MIITKGYGTNLLITKGYGSTSIVVIIKTEFIRLKSYIFKLLSLKSEL